MAGILEANANSFANLDSTLQKFTTLLGSTYIRGQEVYPRPQQAPAFPLYTFATLSHAAALYLADEDLEVVCTGTPSSNTFWEYVGEVLDLDPELVSRRDTQPLRIYLTSIKALRPESLSAPSKTTLVIHYRPLPKDFSSANLPSVKESFKLASTNPLTNVYDTQSVIDQIYGDRTNAEQEQIRENFLRLYRWADNAGIISSKLCLLSGSCLLYSYAGSLAELKRSGNNSNAAQNDSLRDIFASALLYDHIHAPDASGKTMTIKTPSGRNAASNVSPEGVKIFSEAVGHVSRPLWVEQKFELAATRRQGLEDFLIQSQYLVQVTSRCWDAKNFHTFADWMDVLLADLQRRFRTTIKAPYHVRLWPFSLTDAREKGTGDLIHVLDVHADEDDIDDENAVPALDPAELSSVMEDIQQKLSYKRETMFIDIALVKLEDIERIASATVEAVEATAESQSPSSTAATHASRQRDATSDISSTKFRTAAAAMNRLRWDALHQREDYEIGYMDRFAPELIWKPLEKWERMTEEEEFIPEHRIRQIRRARDGWVVWDREKRFDGTDGVGRA